MATVVDHPNTVQIAQAQNKKAIRSRGVNFFALLAIPAVLAVVALFIVPLVLVVLQSLTSPGPGNYSEAIGSGVFQRSLGTTIRMSAIVTLICVVLAYPYSYAMVRAKK